MVTGATFTLSVESDRVKCVGRSAETGTRCGMVEEGFVARQARI